MKAVATALVLIAGAAVVLWFGNTLNSWVLGGLIGGLAALLISIPISLALFSYLSRRHDERMHVESEEEMYLAQVDEYRRPVMRNAQDVYAANDYMLTDEPFDEPFPEQQAQYPRQPLVRALPPAKNVSAEGQRANRLPATRRSANLAKVPEQGYMLSTAPISEKAPIPRRTTRHMNYPGFNTYQPNQANSTRGQLQADALRKARLEATQQYDDFDVSPTNVSRRMRQSSRLSRNLDDDNDADNLEGYEHLRATRQQKARRASQPPSRIGHIIDSVPSQSGSQRVLPAEGGTGARKQEPRTDQLFAGNPRTEPIHRTGQIARQSTQNQPEQTEPVRHALQRRAPYMYEDDPLRQQFAQQINSTPAVRRSSRSQQLEQEDEEW